MTKKFVAGETALPARKAAPRVKTAQHRAIAPQSHEDHQEAIAKIAYILWEKRGCTGGDPVADWLRAEEEYRRRLV